MKRYLKQLFFLLLTLVTALAFKELIKAKDLSGTTLISLRGVSLDLNYSFNTGINFGLTHATTQLWQFILPALGVILSLAIFIWGLRSVHRSTSAGSILFAGCV